MTTTPRTLDENREPEVAAEAGEATGLRALTGYARARVRQGELGLVPAMVGLLVIWTFFQLKEPTFLQKESTPEQVVTAIMGSGRGVAA